MGESKMRYEDVARLLTKHHTALYAYVFACVRSHHDAEDIVQNVSVVVMQSIDELRDESGFLPWAREIGRRCSLAHFRKSRRELPFDPELVQRLAEAADILETKVPTSVHSDALMSCLEYLPPHSQRIMALRYNSSYGDTQEMANLLGRSVQAVYAQVKRIKITLRECVERRLAAERDS